MVDSGHLELVEQLAFWKTVMQVRFRKPVYVKLAEDGAKLPSVKTRTGSRIQMRS